MISTHNIPLCVLNVTLFTIHYRMPAGAPHYVTREGLERIKKELRELKMVKRHEVAQKISQAKELGDLSENAEYQEAKDEMAFIEGHIQRLEDIVAHAVLIEETRPGGIVQIGGTVVAETGGKEVAYQIVGSNEADPKAGKISNESPLGQAFLGRRIGEVVVVKTPGGETSYTIVRIE